MTVARTPNLGEEPLASCGEPPAQPSKVAPGRGGAMLVRRRCVYSAGARDPGAALTTVKER